jgi:hypothetical protein
MNAASRLLNRLEFSGLLRFENFMAAAANAIPTLARSGEWAAWIVLRAGNFP